MQAVTVEPRSTLGDMIFLNCGSVSESENGIVVMIDGGHLAMIHGEFDYEQKLAAAQRFADLLTDVTA